MKAWLQDVITRHQRTGVPKRREMSWSARRLPRSLCPSESSQEGHEDEGWSRARGAPSQEGAGSPGGRHSEGSNEEGPPREDLGRPRSAGQGGGGQREQHSEITQARTVTPLPAACSPGQSRRALASGGRLSPGLSTAPPPSELTCGRSTSDKRGETDDDVHCD